MVPILSLYLLIHLQMLADKVNIPCRLVKGCKYCKAEDASSCVVRFGLERYISTRFVKIHVLGSTFQISVLDLLGGTVTN